MAPSSDEKMSHSIITIKTWQEYTEYHYNTSRNVTTPNDTEEITHKTPGHKHRYKYININHIVQSQSLFKTLDFVS